MFGSLAVVGAAVITVGVSLSLEVAVVGAGVAATRGQEAISYGEYLAGKAPTQVSLGTQMLEGQYVNDLGRVEPWTAHYDDFGRLIGRTDYNAENIAAGIPSIHYHTYEWFNGIIEETGSHIPGVFGQ